MWSGEWKENCEYGAGLDGKHEEWAGLETSEGNYGEWGGCGNKGLGATSSAKRCYDRSVIV